MEHEINKSDLPEKELSEKHAENISQVSVDLNINKMNDQDNELNPENITPQDEQMENVKSEDKNLEQTIDANENPVKKINTDEVEAKKPTEVENFDVKPKEDEHKIENVDNMSENQEEKLENTVENATTNTEKMEITTENEINPNSSFNDAINTLKNSVETIKTDFMTIVNAFKASTESGSASLLDKANSLKQLLDYGSTSPDDSSESDSEDTDSDSDSADGSFQIVTTATITNQPARIKPKASDTESSSSSSSEDYDTFDSNSDSDESVKIVKPDNAAKKPPPKKEVRAKGEIRLCDLPPIENLHITVPEENCTELGVVSAIVEELVVIQSLPTMPALDIETVLFLNKGQETLGKIFDVFGPVNNPCYSVRFNNNEEILAKKVEVGTTVYCAPSTEHTSYVVIPDLMKVRGSDASWREDNEPPTHLLEFSDDEEERRMRAKQKNKQRSTETSSKRLTEFERRKNERNLYLNEHFKKNSPNPRRYNPETNWAYNRNRPQSQNNQWWHRARPSWMMPPMGGRFPPPFSPQPNPFFNNGSAALASQQPPVAFPFYPVAPGAVPTQADFAGAVLPPLHSFQQPPSPPPPPQAKSSAAPSEADV